MKKYSIIKDFRNSLLLSRAQFAKKLGVTYAAICYYESHSRFPCNKIAYKILAMAKKSGFPLTLEDLYPRIR